MRDCFADLIVARPQLVEAHLGLGLTLKDLGQIEEAVAAFDRAVQLRPDDVTLHGNRLYALNFHPDWSPAAIAAEHCVWGARYADPLSAAAPPHANDRNPDRKLRVGYVSPYLRNHALNFFVEPVMAEHDHTRFEIFAYGDVPAPDDVTRRLQSLVDVWRPTAGLSDADLAAQIRGDAIDVLVDLSGHMGAHRLMAFARRPAPVQVTYLGYQATTGMAAMDYRLTDAFADPPATTEPWHREQLWRLPQPFFCYRPPAESPSVAEPPNVRRGNITFGSFNLFAKVNRRVLRVWGQLLRQVPTAELQLLVPEDPALEERVLAEYRDQQIATDRIRFVPRSGRGEYLRQYQTVDIALDPFPFNGHTTLCDSLWMGVPVVTLCGQSYVQRYGSVALAQLGMHDWIAADEQQYLQIAAQAAAQPERLCQLRELAALPDGALRTARRGPIYAADSRPVIERCGSAGLTELGDSCRGQTQAGVAVVAASKGRASIGQSTFPSSARRPRRYRCAHLLRSNVQAVEEVPGWPLRRYAAFFRPQARIRASTGAASRAKAARKMVDGSGTTVKVTVLG